MLCTSFFNDYLDMKNYILLTLIVTIPFWSAGQVNEDFENFSREIRTYKKLARYADSLKSIGAVGQLSNGLKNTTDSLDKLPPKGYYEKVFKLMDSGNYNDASFLFYLGNLRYGYYNLTNPNYSKSNDGALLASFNYVLGEPLTYYLKVYPDNYIEILKKSLNWYLVNDYPFCTKAKDPKGYTDQSDKLGNAIKDLEKNKTTYQATWDKEREELNKTFDNALEQMKKKRR